MCTKISRFWCVIIMSIAMPARGDWRDTVAGMLPATLVAREQASDECEIPLIEGDEVACSIKRGNVRLEIWDEKTVKCRVIKHARTAHDVAQCTMTTGTVASEGKRSRHTITIMTPGDIAYVDVTIFVPSWAILSIAVDEDGSVKTADLTDNMQIAVKKGPIDIMASKTQILRVSSESGNIRYVCEEWSPTSSVLMTARLGSISCTLPAETWAQFDARSKQGKITSDLPVTLAPIRLQKVHKNSVRDMMRSMRGFLGNDREGDDVCGANVTLEASGDIAIVVEE